MIGRAELAAWVGEEGVPAHPDLGERYPWHALQLHALSREHIRRVDEARRTLHEAVDWSLDWRLALSCGKDSTALGLLLAGEGMRPAGMSVKDDLDYPGERRYLEKLSEHTGLPVEIVTPAVSLQSHLVEHRISLVEDVHSRSAQLSIEHFYGLLDRYRARTRHEGVILGLRAEESRGRRWNATRGAVYRREYDGLTVAQPLRRWSALDVHAYLLARGVPPLPVYLCIDPGMDPLSLRKSWWIAGGMAATIGGHYTWLRRWWPTLWERAVSIDPEVATIS